MIAASEAFPFFKTGGLADVASSLSRALDELGHDVWLFVPYYRKLYEQKRESLPRVEQSGLSFDLKIGPKRVRGDLLWTQLPHSDVNVLLIDQPVYFDRDSLYQENGQDYSDNCERFCFFSRAVMEVSRRMVLRPNVIHANDWQTGLLPVLLETEYRKQAAFRDAISVMTIHNLAFQGRFWWEEMKFTGLHWDLFNWEQMESYGSLNLLKSGLVFADKLTTVSPTYAKEIQTRDFGHGLEGVLQHRAGDLTGILNGIDEREWNPAIDPALPQNYDRSSILSGKEACKQELQARLGLPERSEPALFGMISRLTSQKGLDLIVARADEILSHDVQMVFLGTGDPHYEHLLRELQHRYPEKVVATIGYHEELAHLIEAGSDIYLMPSQFEPCGLNQLYSLKYGTLPIVHRVGGLADSVCPATEENINAGLATGFVFQHYEDSLFMEEVERALSLYKSPGIWYRLTKAAMQQKFSWEHSAREYLDVYQDALNCRKLRQQSGS